MYGHGQELLSTTDANNHTSSDQYDSRYRLVETTDANGGVTQITLDPAGNRVKLVDSDGNATTWTFSPTNLPLTETNALGTTTTTYNLNQEATSIQDADGRLRDFVYDDDQRLTAENWMQGSNIVATMAYGYDLAGELTSASDANSAYAFAYNGDGQVTSVDNAGTPNVPRVVLASGYDLLGDRTSLSATIAGTADFANTYSYDADQQLTMVQQQGVNGGNIVSPKEIDYGYNAIGQFTSMVDYNYIGQGPRSDVLTGTYGYDNGARLAGIAYTSNGGTDTIDTLGWGYDPANNVTSFSSIDGTAAYGYDPTNQLTSASYTTASGGHQPANESFFSFDLNGNRDSSGYTTGSDNLMTSDGTYTYQHDADGNLISRTQIANTYSTQYQTTYTWDYRNRLTDVGYYDNNDVLTKHVHFVYDVFDHLIATEVDPTGGGTYTDIQRYVLDVSPEIPQAGVPGTALAQPDLIFDGNQNPIQRNLVALSPAGVDQVMVQGTVVSTSQGDNDIFVADDNLGTPRDDTNGTGTLVNHKVFSVYGQDVYDSNSSIVNWSGFGGGHTDPNTGLVNDYHRCYNPATGKWESQDPERFAAGDANLDRYVGNNPASAVDPLGLEPAPDSGPPSDQDSLEPSGPYIAPAGWPSPVIPPPGPLPPTVVPANWPTPLVPPSNGSAPWTGPTPHYPPPMLAPGPGLTFGQPWTPPPWPGVQIGPVTGVPPYSPPLLPGVPFASGAYNAGGMLTPLLGPGGVVSGINPNNYNYGPLGPQNPTPWLQWPHGTLRGGYGSWSIGPWSWQPYGPGGPTVDGGRFIWTR